MTLFNNTAFLEYLKKKFFDNTLLILLFSCIFPFVLTTDKLYTADQLSYFIKGLAKAGNGYLNHDWIAPLKAIYPVFDWLVYLSAVIFHHNVFYIYHVIVSILFFYFLIKIPSLYKSPTFLTIVTTTATFYMLFNTKLWSSIDWFSPFHPNTFVRGVANQYLLEKHFIPSSFGVLFLVSIYTFLKQNWKMGILWCCIALTFHPAMIIPAGALILAYLVIIYQKSTPKKMLLYGLLALSLATPIILYTLWFCIPSSIENSLEMIAINKLTFPMQQDLFTWFDNRVYIKLGIILLASWYVRKTPLCTIILTSLSTCILLTGLSAFPEHYIVPSLIRSTTPWRILALLVPISSMICLFNIWRFITKTVIPSIKQSIIFWFFILICLLSPLYEGGKTLIHTFTTPIEKNSYENIVNYIKHNKKEGHVYLTPFENSDLRLKASVPVFVDKRGFPTEDWAIIEWNKRRHLVQNFYNTPTRFEENLFFKRYKEITHAILPQDHPYTNLFKLIYKNNNYGLYKVASHY